MVPTSGFRRYNLLRSCLRYKYQANCLHRPHSVKMSTSQIDPKSLESFHAHLRQSTRVLALLGAGLSASYVETGVQSLPYALRVQSETYANLFALQSTGQASLRSVALEVSGEPMTLYPSPIQVLSRRMPALCGNFTTTEGIWHSKLHQTQHIMP